MCKKDKTLDHGVMASTSPTAIPNLQTKLISTEGKGMSDPPNLSSNRQLEFLDYE